MLSHVPKPSKAKGFLQAGHLGVSTKLGILGQLDIFFLVGWRKLALSVLSIPFSSILTFLWFGIAIHAIAGNGTRWLSNATTTHDHYKMEATNPQKEWLPETSGLYRMGTPNPHTWVSCQKGNRYKMKFNIIKSKSSCPPGITIKWKYQPPRKKPS